MASKGAQGNFGVRHHSKWGYDLDAVASMRCLTCGDPIKDEAYVEETALARFGQMMFRHARCRDRKLCEIESRGQK